MTDYSIIDRTGSLRNFGDLGKVSGFVVHHSGGRGNVEGVVKTLQDRGLAAHFVIDRDGNTYQVHPDNQKSAHIMPSKVNDFSNANTMGVEVIANDDKDVLPVQVEAAKKLISALGAKHGFGPDKVFGHGEVNPGHKQDTEGMTIVNAIRGGGFVPVGNVAFVSSPAVSNEIKTAMTDAANKLGIDPKLLETFARRESSFNPDAVNKTSGTKGLYQFQDKTWEDAKRIYGAALGVPPDASPFDPKYSSIMAAAVTKENMMVIKNLTGRDATNGELYIAHFLGGKQAVNMINANEKTPDALAAALFAPQAAANPKIFYDENGMPKTVAQVYAHLTDDKDGAGAVPAQVAAGEDPDPRKKTAEAAPEFKFTPVTPVGPAVQKQTGSAPQLESETEKMAARVAGRGKGLMG